jgi:ribosomal-protein-alanine N-acetyltransferase
LQRRIWVAEDTGGIAGFAVGRVLAAGGAVEAELESVAVAAKVRRQGVGRALCAAVIAWSRERGAPAVELEVRASSQGAIALYTALGFVPNGRRAMYYRHPVEDALLMSLSVL